MKIKTEQKLRKTIRRWIILFMVFLILSGLTAFPLETELKLLVSASTQAPDFLKQWLNGVYNAIRETNSKYPFMAYGTDWLAFAHLVIAVAFYGPLKDPVRNSWVIQFGMIACLMILPLASICGPIRGIPFYWQLIDCSFGIIGFIPLYICYKRIQELEHLSFTTK
jgi:hypothetical protein